MMGNKQSNLSRLPGAKTLMHGLVLILNPRQRCYWDSRAVAKELTDITPALGLLPG